MTEQTHLLRTAALFYAVLVAVALVWGALAGRPWLFVLPDGTTWTLVGLGALLGLLSGLLVVGLSQLALSYARWGKSLLAWFFEILGPLTTRDAIFLAGWSALGEELFFRGAMQPALGLHLTSLLFGLLHVPLHARLAPWTAFAIVVGYLFGVMTAATGNLAAAITAHFVINALNLRRIGMYRHSEQADLLQDAGDPL